MEGQLLFCLSFDITSVTAWQEAARVLLRICFSERLTDWLCLDNSLSLSIYIFRLQKELDRVNRTWEMKVTILQQT